MLLKISTKFQWSVCSGHVNYTKLVVSVQNYVTIEISYMSYSVSYLRFYGQYPQSCIFNVFMNYICS